MAFTECDVATNNISALDDQPNDVGGLSAAQLKAAFDKFGAEFVAWFNTTHLAEADAHLAESASKHINESGANENGRYIKFDDGTMICWADNISLGTVTISTVVGSLYVSAELSVPYPATFVGAPAVSSTVRYSSAGYPWIVKADTADNSNSVYKFCLMAAESSTITSVLIKFVAIGRWKA